jgi:CDP-glycerol glycerophosphotransferase (TagB/SpsB family)
VPTYVVGAPQFDVFFQERYRQTREAFCAAQGLDPRRPIILYALGSPNLIREHHGALWMAQQVMAGRLGDAQLLVRPHPVYDEKNEARALSELRPRVVVQQTGKAISGATRSQDDDQILDWVNTFRHADVVVNLSSTVTVDAAMVDRPVVNLDYDPEPGQPNQSLVKDINHVWTHFKPLAESGGVWLVQNPEELLHAVRTYLEQPWLHREQRRWIPEYVCGYADGRSGERLAKAIEDFVLSS